MKLSILLAKLALALLLMIYFIREGIISFTPLWRLSEWPLAAVISVAMLYLTLPLGALRWFLLLRSHGIRLKWSAVYHINAIGNFAGVFMPGAAGGDALRLLYAAGEAGKGFRAATAISVAVDRVTGLLGLFAVANGALVLRLAGGSMQADLWRMLPIVVAVLAGGIVIGAIGILLCARLVDHPRAAAWSEKGRVGEAFVKLVSAVAAYRHHVRVLLTVFVLAIATHVLTVAALVAVAVVMSVGPLSAADYSVATPLALVANVVPLTPGGLGLGEGAFSTICSLLDPSEGSSYGTIFLAYRALTLVALLTGGYSWLVYRRPIGVSATPAN